MKVLHLKLLKKKRKKRKIQEKINKKEKKGKYRKKRIEKKVKKEQKEKKKKKKKKEHDDGKFRKEDLDCLQYWLMVLVKLLQSTNKVWAFISFSSNPTTSSHITSLIKSILIEEWL